MADLNDDGRGQILLIAAFALAVIFVSLALVANSAIYTENLATRGGSVDAADVLVERHAIAQAAGDTVEAANWNNHSDGGGYGDIQGAVDDSIHNLGEWEARHAGRESTMVSTSYAPGSDDEGRRLVQTDDTTFESSDSGGVTLSDWTLAETVERTRAFEMTITNVDTTGSPFTVNVTDAPTEPPAMSTNWTMSVDESSGELVLTVDRDGLPAPESCRVPASYPVTIDVTGAVVDGTACPALDIVDDEPLHFGAEVDSDYHVRFENGDRVTGSYSLIVDEATIPAGNYGSPGGSASQPYDFPAMYEAVVGLEYHTRGLDYVTEIRVAPGEPNG